MTATASIGALPDALRDEGELTRRFAGRRPTNFVDSNGTLTSTCVGAARGAVNWSSTSDGVCSR